MKKFFVLLLSVMLLFSAFGCGGGGGGRPTMAQAGGKNPDGIEAAFEQIRTMLSSLA